MTASGNRIAEVHLAGKDDVDRACSEATKSSNNR
jgi:hypothetical protein